ncbi:AMP-binding protein [Microdochium nivale]|nr:AMP-binding protein [Microdochium nivale]
MMLVGGSGDGDGSEDKQVSRAAKCGLKRSSILWVHDLMTAPAADDDDDDTNTSPVRLEPHDKLCCIFTSGSTGRPKGLFLEHGAVRLWHEGYHAQRL